MEIICGLDEAGRGPLAGPVTAAAVILSPAFPVSELKDSKMLSEKRRIRLSGMIIEQAHAFGVGWVWPEEIDTINIHWASLLAMERAFAELKFPGKFRAMPDRAFADGKYPPGLPVPCEAVIKGDSKIPAIMAASILAKTARDKWMIRYSWLDPRYGFEKHKGYPTREHRKLCRIHGISPIHRKSFRIFPDGQE